MKTLLNLISDQPTPAHSGKVLVLSNPSTGEPQSEIPDSDLMDVVRALKAAHQAAGEWAKTPLEKRIDILLKAADLIENNALILAQADSSDQGLPIHWALQYSIPRSAKVIRDFVKLMHQLQEENQASENMCRHFPIGVVALITPWSDPLLTLTRKLIPILLQGNVVIAKPSRWTPTSALLLGKILLQAGLPPGVFNVLLGRGETVGEALVSHPGIPVISFTGKTENGIQVLSTSAEYLKKVQLSLGARNASLIFADIDLERDLPAIVQSSFHFQADTSARASRLFVQESIYKDFLQAFKKHTESLIVGHPSEPSTFLGPLVSLKERQLLESAFQQAKTENGKLLMGEIDANSLFVKPIAFYDLTGCSTLQQDDIAGPMVTISSFKYQHEAAKNANNSPLGQVAYVWTSDASRGLKVASEIQAGRVFINNWNSSCADLSYSGLKHSGYGQENGRDALAFFARRTIILQKTRQST
jgi:aminomuconate-semialdehyde/2-hydroxymuconate-6-semialdehyde dehydrogenase